MIAQVVARVQRPTVRGDDTALLGSASLVESVHGRSLQRQRGWRQLCLFSVRYLTGYLSNNRSDVCKGFSSHVRPSSCRPAAFFFRPPHCLKKNGIWPDAKHPLCVFHLLRDVLDKVLDAVRRLRRAQARRGRAGRKRRRGRPSKQPQARRRQRGPTAKEKAAFVWQRRFLIVKRMAKLTKAEWEELEQLFAYLPELRPLWSFSQDLYRLLDNSQTLRVARWRSTWLRYDPKYQGVRELVEALELLAEPKLAKAMAFVQQPAGRQVRTNNHVERLNRRLRFAEKVR